MWGVSLGDYIIYWAGLIVITIGTVIASIIGLIRNLGDRS